METNEGITRAGLRIEVQNPSLHKAHLNSVILMYPFRRAPLRDHLAAIFRYRRFPTYQNWCLTSLDHLGVDDGCPVAIEPNQAHAIFIEDDVLDDYLGDASTKPLIRVIAQDALWRNRYSKPFKYP